MAIGLMAVAMLPWTSPVGAQTDYPVRPITLVVPFPAGGPTDASARLYAQVIGEALHQTVVIDNRAGAAGTVGSAYVARATPDGYTLLWGGTSTLAVAPGLYRDLRYDAASFVPIGMALRGPLLLAASPNAGLGSLGEVLAAARKRNLTVGTAGVGSIGHLATEWLKEVADLPLTHVPYRGGGPALADALGGQIDLIFDNASALYPLVRSGRLKAIAVTGAQPYAPGPEVPTMTQALGGKPFQAYSWFGLVVPRGTPPAIVRKLTEAFEKAAGSTEVRSQLAQQGLEPGLPTAREFGAVIEADFKKWSGIVTRAKVQPE